MRLLIILFTLMASFQLSCARELEVKSFTALPFDLTAATKPRLDLNGNPCALIKVCLPIENCDFEGNILGSVTFKTNEYYVYVSQGTKRIAIKAPDNSPLMVEFKDYDIPYVESKSTYQLVLNGEFGVSSSTQMQQLTVKYTPTDGILYINEAVMSSPENNGLVSVTLPVGTYKYKFKFSNDNKNIEGIVRLFSSAPTEITLTPDGEVHNENETITDEQQLYEQAINELQIGNDTKAEEIALLGLSKGFDIFNDILAALYYAGYYDELPPNEINAVISRIAKFNSARVDLDSYRAAHKGNLDLNSYRAAHKGNQRNNAKIWTDSIK
ncbi:MAG: hypothetical protein ACI30M_04450 [Muribaculaceae bacterium]